MLRNTSSESTVICHIQIKLIPNLFAVVSCWLNRVLGVWRGGGGGIGLQHSFGLSLTLTWQEYHLYSKFFAFGCI